MLRKPVNLRLRTLALWCGLLAGCGGELIRLGDGPNQSPLETGGSAGLATGGTASGGGIDSVAMAGSAAGADSCPSSGILASEVVWLGDSWVQVPGVQHTRVRDLARAAGSIAADEDYADRAAPAADMVAVTRQYESQLQEATKPKVLLMDGGTWDAVAANLAGASVDAAVASSVAAFEQFLAEVASDGSVEQIVYFLVPELPSIPGVASIRPSLRQACANSAVPCHFIDLQPLWAGHPEYTAGDGIQASSAGAEVIADSIWSTMQDNCIAQ